jgi:peptidoglycan/xylan/chitin deacetylase (PgdA/CDA1 family)
LFAARRLPAVVAAVPDAIAASGAWPHRVAAVVREILHTHRIGLSIVVLLQAAALGSLLAVFRSYGRDVLDVSFRTELLLLAPAAALAAAAVVIGGALSDRVGRIPLLGAGSIIAGLAVWMLSALSSPLAAMPFLALAALGLALMMPSVSALCMDLSRTASAATLLAWFLTMEGIGHAAGPAAGAWLSDRAGTVTALWMVGGLFLGISVVTLVPPIWATLPFNPRAAAGRMNRVLALGLKGSLVAGIALPVLTTYWAMTPSSQLYGHIITHGPRDRMEVALTFDDGPSDPWTERIAAELDSLHVKGTFFMIGANVDRHPQIARWLAADGHLIGNHSYNHRKSDAVLDVDYGEVGKAEHAIAQAAGVCPAFYRPPNGFHTPWQLRAVKHAHMHTVTWDIIPKDWKDPPPAVIVERVLSSVQPGSIILLHDGYNKTDGTDRSVVLEALPKLVQGLRDKGYEPVRLDQLLSIDPYLPTCEGLAGSP